MKVFADADTILSWLLFEKNESVLLEFGRLRALRLACNEYVVQEAKRALRREEFSLDEERQLLLKYMLGCVPVTEDPYEKEIKKLYDLLRDKIFQLYWRLKKITVNI